MPTWDETVAAARAKYDAVMQAAEAKYLADFHNPERDEAAINLEYATVTLAAQHEYETTVQAAYAAEHEEAA